MKNEEIYEKIRESVQLALGNEHTTKLVVNEKLNGTVQTSLAVSMPGSAIIPNLHLEWALEAYTSGRSSLEEITEQLLETYQHSQTHMKFLSSDFPYKDWDFIKEKLAIRLVSKKRNPHLTQDFVHKEFLDMLAIVTLMVSIESDHFETMKVPYQLLKDWNVSEDEVLKIALENSPKLLPPVVSPLWNRLKECMQITDLEDSDINIPLYIVTNEFAMNGASAILYDGLLEDLRGTLGCNLLILPSSIHECLILPAIHKFSPDNATEVQEMVQKINDTLVASDSVLTDSVYLYNENGFSIVAEEAN